jgi:hypothetical protein
MLIRLKSFVQLTNQIVRGLVHINTLAHLIDASQIEIDGTAHVLLVVVIWEARL